MWKKTKKKLIGNFINLNYTKNKINNVVMDIFASFIKIHLNSLFCLLLTTHYIYIDFFIQTLISISFYYYGSFFNNIVYIYKKKFLYLTNYFINNYSKENIDIWKKKIIFGINCYLILILYSINITSNILILYSIQYMFYLLILDYINNNKWKPYYFKLKKWYNKPKTTYYNNIQLNINENYINDFQENETKELEYIKYKYNNTNNLYNDNNELNNNNTNELNNNNTNELNNNNTNELNNNTNELNNTNTNELNNTNTNELNNNTNELNNTNTNELNNYNELNNNTKNYINIETSDYEIIK